MQELFFPYFIGFREILGQDLAYERDMVCEYMERDRLSTTGVVGHKHELDMLTG